MPALYPLILVLAVGPGEPTTLPMPPPPAGMSVLPSGDAHGVAQAAPAKGDDDEEADAEDEGDSKESEELEEMRAMEEVALDPSARPSAAVLQSLRRLGIGNPLHDRIADVLEDPELRLDGANIE